ncbi:otubain, partial [Trifolium pratense]
GKVVEKLTKQGASETFFPLRGIPLSDPSSLILCVGAIPGHFVYVKLKDGCPIPPTCIRWKKHCSAEAAEWDEGASDKEKGDKDTRPTKATASSRKKNATENPPKKRVRKAKEPQTEAQPADDDTTHPMPTEPVPADVAPEHDVGDDRDSIVHDMEVEESMREGDDDGQPKVRSPVYVNPYEDKPEPEVFPGGPKDKTVLTDYGSTPHIAKCVYDEFDRECIQSVSNGEKLFDGSSEVHVLKWWDEALKANRMYGLAQTGCGPIRVRYLPERVLWQFGYIQTIPRHPHAAANPLTIVPQINQHWLQHMDRVLTTGMLGSSAARPSDTAPGYITWYYDISHPHIIPFHAGYRVPLLESEVVFVVANVDVAESSQR